MSQHTSAITPLPRTRWTPRFHLSSFSPSEVIEGILAHRGTTEAPKEPYQDEQLEAISVAIISALGQQKHILLYGDYDVDGTMSCVQWVWFFEAIGYHHYDVYIPDRDKGYGVHGDVIKGSVREKSTAVIITMDTGITAKEEAQWCAENGVLFIVTDHHEVREDCRPESTLILNPRLTEQTEYHNLCGAGVTYLLIDDVIKRGGYQLPGNFFGDCLAVAALATVCDVMPLWGGNRQLVKNGLTCFGMSTRPVLKMLREKYSSSSPEARDFGFRIGPLINSAGRLSRADLVVETFRHDHSPEVLETYMAELEELSAERKQLSEKVFSDIDARISSRASHVPMLFFGDENWHPGVVGIVAGRLAERYHKPTWIFAIHKETGLCRGSVRSMPSASFHVVKAMESVGDLMEKFGGHGAAGGFSFPRAHLPEIQDRLMAYATDMQKTHGEMWVARWGYECTLPLENVSLELAEAIGQLKPFGHEFNEPLFRVGGVCSRVDILNDKKSGEPKHTVFYLRNLESDKSNTPSAKSSPSPGGQLGMRVVFFGRVDNQIEPEDVMECLLYLRYSQFRGQWKVDLIGKEYRKHQGAEEGAKDGAEDGVESGR